MTIQRSIAGFRFAETNRGDTLQTVAYRELGDASRWPELVSFNGLHFPFLTDDPAQEGPGVLLTGRLIRVPAAAQASQTVQDAEALYERDLQLVGGDVPVDGGDFATVGGLANLRQALSNRLQTERGELVFHPSYGSLLRRLIGVVNGPTAAILAASYAKSCVQADPRVSRVRTSKAEVLGDSLSVAVVAEPVVGQSVELNEVV